MQCIVLRVVKQSICTQKFMPLNIIQVKSLIRTNGSPFAVLIPCLTSSISACRTELTLVRFTVCVFANLTHLSLLCPSLSVCYSLALFVVLCLFLDSPCLFDEVCFYHLHTLCSDILTFNPPQSCFCIIFDCSDSVINKYITQNNKTITF